MMRHRLPTMPVLLGLVGAMGACGDRPANTDLAHALAALIDEGDDSRLRIISVTRSDGRADGANAYTVWFDAHASFLTTSSYEVNTERITTVEYVLPESPFDWYAAQLPYSHSLAFRGDQLIVSGQVQFERRERGWSPSKLSWTTIVHDSTTRAVVDPLIPVRDDMALMSDVLRALAPAQESYFSDWQRYETSPRALGVTVPATVTLTINASQRGWSATATHDSLPGIRCGAADGDSNPVVDTVPANRIACRDIE